MSPFASPQVQAAFDAFPAHLSPGLLQLRELIFATAAKDKAIGPLEECLKWGQPAYLTSVSKSGTTLRLGVSKKTQGKALFVHCQSRLVSDFQTQFPDALSFDGTRALLLSEGADLTDDKIPLFIRRALTYHLLAPKRRQQNPARPFCQSGRVAHNPPVPKPRVFYAPFLSCFSDLRPLYRHLFPSGTGHAAAV